MRSAGSSTTQLAVLSSSGLATKKTWQRGQWLLTRAQMTQCGHGRKDFRSPSGRAGFPATPCNVEDLVLLRSSEPSQRAGREGRTARVPTPGVRREERQSHTHISTSKADRGGTSGRGWQVTGESQPKRVTLPGGLATPAAQRWRWFFFLQRFLNYTAVL